MNSSYQLVTTVTRDKLKLNGLYASKDLTHPACIFIHGFITDFYSYPFYHHVTGAALQAGYSIILAQHRGTGIETQFIKSDDETIYRGSYFEKIEQSHLDISAWIEFLLSEGHQEIILIGHSLGTIKSVRYLFEGKHKKIIKKLILLAPFDKNAYVEKKTLGQWHQHVKLAKTEIDKGHELERIPHTFDDFPASYRTYYSWYKLDDLGRMFDFYDKKYSFPVLNAINIPVEIIVGDRDEYFYMPEYNQSAAEVCQILENNIKQCRTHLIKGSDHCFVGHEPELAKLISASLESTQL